MPKVATKNDDPFESDEALGIGKEEDTIADILNNPVLAKLIDAAVEARLAKGAALTAGGSTETSALVAAMERMLQLQAMQQPGYVKPVSSDEMERRASGKIEMEALLREFESKGTPPRYVLGAKFYAGDELHDEGKTIDTYLPPAESFQPVNESAQKVYAAMLQWIGGHSEPIGEQVEAAMRASKAIPLVGSAGPVAPASPVHVVADAPLRDMKPKRVSGTSVPETHGVSMASTATTAPMPTGPVFINP